MVIGVIGEEKYLSMQEQYRVRWKWTVADLKDIRKGLKDELSLIENDWGEMGV